jgi:predicted enzyme related to lactoylglutathione lyase
MSAAWGKICVAGAFWVAALSIHPANAQSATPQDPTFPRIAFVKIDVNDLDATSKAYCQALGMQDIGRIHSKTPLIDEATLKFGAAADEAKASNHTGIVLVFKPGRKPLHGAPGKTPSAVLTVPSVEDTVKHATDAGFTVVEKPRSEGTFSVAMVADASGNVIELIHLP